MDPREGGGGRGRKIKERRKGAERENKGEIGTGGKEKKENRCGKEKIK